MKKVPVQVGGYDCNKWTIMTVSLGIKINKTNRIEKYDLKGSGGFLESVNGLFNLHSTVCIITVRLFRSVFLL